MCQLLLCLHQICQSLVQAGLPHQYRLPFEFEFCQNYPEQTRESEQGTRQDLVDLGIYCDHLVVTPDKAGYIIEHGINIYFDDADEYFLKLPESMTVFKIREPWNFDFENPEWLYSDKTGKLNIVRY